VDPERRGPLTDRAARAFIGLLAAEPDTLVAANHGPGTARARPANGRPALLGGDRSTSGDIDATAVHDADLRRRGELAAAFVDEDQPGTTADLTCAALYVALRHGAEVSP